MRRLIFALLTAAIALVFSEKLYWYVTGYSTLDLLVGYFFPSYLFLVVVDFFRVRRLAPLFLAAAIFGFVAEGMLTHTLYRDGPLGWFGVAYTPLAWHAPLSIVFGWWWLRRELVAGRTRRLLLGCTAIGVLWGLWSLAWWLPENTADPELLAQGARLGQWPVADYALHAFAFTGLLALAHWLLGRGGWQVDFRPAWPAWTTAAEVALVIVGLLVFFGSVVLPVYPWAPLKLMLVLLPTLGALALHRRRAAPGSLLADLAGPVALRPLAALFVMPAAAVGVYALAGWAALSPDAILLVSGYGLVIGPAVLGALAWVVALVMTARERAMVDDRKALAK